MVAAYAGLIVLLLAIAAELWHARRIHRVASLAFGPTGRAAVWSKAAPALRAASMAAVTWGLITLLLLPAKVHVAAAQEDNEIKHLMLVLDVSPSMRLQDAGPEMNVSRRKRSFELMESFFRRIAVSQYKISVIGVYTGAKPVVVDTKDVEVVRNILDDLPMQYAFKVGKTDLFSGLQEAAKIAQPWEPKSTTLILLSDGDTVPAQGMPKMPDSIANVLILGVGDPVTGKFIDGRQSRQDASTLRQLAARLHGTYHNGNTSHVATNLIQQITQAGDKSPLEKLTLREYALLACGVGGFCLAILPVLLHFWGTSFQPGHQPVTGAASPRKSRSLARAV